MRAMKHEAVAPRKFSHALRAARKHMPPGLPGALFLTDPDRTPHILEAVRNMPAGIGVVLRHFGAADAPAQAARLADLCRAQNRTLLISADPAMARDVGASGTHWPARLAGRIPAARRTFRGGLVTMSVHTVAELRMARAAGADAILVSPVFASDSPSAGRPLGLPRLAAITRSAGRAVYALGGIDASTAGRTARLSGLASVSGLYEAYRPKI